jgi:hypothetical protein
VYLSNFQAKVFVVELGLKYILTRFLYGLTLLHDRDVENHDHGCMELRLCLNLQNVGKSNESITVTSRKQNTAVVQSLSQPFSFSIF